jgi:hypothetical protein
VVPLARRQALGIAVMSYNGHLGFGLLADYDALPDLDAIAADLEHAIAALARAAGVRAPRRRAAGAAKQANARAGRRNGSEDGSPQPTRRRAKGPETTASAGATAKR